MGARGERTATRNKTQATKKNSRSRKPEGKVTLRDISLLRVFGGMKGAGRHWVSPQSGDMRNMYRIIL